MSVCRWSDTTASFMENSQQGKDYNERTKQLAECDAAFEEEYKAKAGQPYSKKYRAKRLEKFRQEWFSKQTATE